MRFTSDTRLCSVALPNGGRPETRQNRVDASEYTSEAAVGGSPARTSGAACTMVPVMPTGDARGRRGQLGQPEIGDLGLAEAGEQDVLGLEVTVEDARPVSGLDGSGDPPAVVEDVGDVEGPPLRQLVGQRSPVEELHDDEEPPVDGRPGLVHRDDVRVAGKRPDGRALPSEPVGRRRRRPGPTGP